MSWFGNIGESPTKSPPYPQPISAISTLSLVEKAGKNFAQSITEGLVGLGISLKFCQKVD